jgi:hypothetical protein
MPQKGKKKLSIPPSGTTPNRRGAGRRMICVRNTGNVGGIKLSSTVVYSEYMALRNRRGGDVFGIAELEIEVAAATNACI